MRGSVCDDQETVKGSLKAATKRALEMLGKNERADEIEICRYRGDRVDMENPAERVTREWI